LRGTGISLASLDRSLDALFAPKDAPAAVILINSPGGSPVQSSLVGQRIRALAEEKKRPGDRLRRGRGGLGRLLARLRRRRDLRRPSSIVGSIGVVSSGFGFQDAIARLGIERRVHTAGRRKTLLDPFRPERPEDLELLKGVQADVHARFIAWVRSRRGTRLNEDGEPLFDGTIWTGERALGLGLIDGLAEPRAIVRQRFGDKARLRFIGPGRGWLARRLRRAPPRRAP
jgi:ClpP class serine protease